MDKINFLQLFGEIDDKIVRQANDALNLYQESQEGISFRADYSHISTLKTVIASVACTAAALFGVFVLLLNIGKLRLSESPEHNSGAVDSIPEQSAVDPTGKAAYLTMYSIAEGNPNKYTDECWLSKSEDHTYFAQCTVLENCTVKIEGANTTANRRLEFSAKDIIPFMATIPGGQIGFHATMTVIDPEKPAKAVIIIGSSTENLPELSE